jgi:hypothetical protein
MPLIKAKSKLDKSSCSFEKDGMKCGTAIHKGDDYLYDTDARKGYCTKHDELNAKSTEPQRGGSGGFKSGAPPLCRSPQEGKEAVLLWHGEIMPLIKEKTSELVDSSSSPAETRDIFETIARIYQEIFLGKFTPSQIAK